MWYTVYQENNLIKSGFKLKSGGLVLMKPGNLSGTFVFGKGATSCGFIREIRSEVLKRLTPLKSELFYSANMPGKERKWS